MMSSIQSAWDIVVIFALVSLSAFTILRFAKRSPRWLVITVALQVVQFFAIEIYGGTQQQTISENYIASTTLAEMLIGTTILYVVLMVHWVDLWWRRYGLVRKIANISVLNYGAQASYFKEHVNKAADALFLFDAQSTDQVIGWGTLLWNCPWVIFFPFVFVWNIGKILVGRMFDALKGI